MRIEAVYSKLLFFILFLALISLPILFHMNRINSQNDRTKKQLFIQEKIGTAYIELENETPIIKTILDKEKLPRVDFYNKIKEGDLIFIYQKRGIAVFLSSESEDIVGISTIK